MSVVVLSVFAKWGQIFALNLVGLFREIFVFLFVRMLVCWWFEKHFGKVTLLGALMMCHRFALGAPLPL